MANESVETENRQLFPTIIYEDDDIVVIDKPSGLVVHGDGKSGVKTLVDWIVDRHPTIHDVGEPIVLQSGVIIHRPGIVHRLDKETSGIMVIAKHKTAYEFFKEQFKARAVRKIYHACVYGVVKQDKGVIDFAIGRSRKDFRLRSAQPRAKGDLREAVTHYRTVVRGTHHSYLELEPKTGRTHQLRVHLKAIHHPIIGDALYAPSGALDLGFTRMALHAYQLTLPMLQGEPRIFEAALPSVFVEAGRQIKDEGIHLRDE
jgi:23S rRNA pseudouridine1911/1915/1917 synthase